MMPVVGLLEKYGLQERAALLIRRAGGASAGRVLWLYQVMREGFSTLGLNVGGHASMVRPLIAPMAEGAAQARRSGTAGGHSPAGEATGPAKLPAHGSGSAVPGHSPAREVTAPVPLPPSLSADVR